MNFKEAIKIRNAVKEKYNNATHQERLYFNSYLAATSVGTIFCVVGLLLSAFFGFSFLILTGIFTTHPYNLIQLIFLLSTLIFLVGEAIFFILVIESDTKRFIKLLQYK